jgi:putative phosphoserine phosphatase/1-acylglycerol-3-phosphate O-acyltransferase
MALHQDVVAEVEALPDGPQIGAFFDFDGTVIAGFSATTFIREQVKRGDLSPKEFLELAKAMVKFGLGNTGFSAMMVVSCQFMRGFKDSEYRAFGEQLFQKYIAKIIYPESRALINAHLRKGHTVAIISSATPYQVEPAAKDLGVDNVLCTQLEIEHGELTGSVVHPTCFGPGKVTAAEQMVDKYGVDLKQSFFYSDSDDDLLLLERVGNPRPLNPNRKLTEIAELRRWPIRRFSSRGRPGLKDWTRSVAATSSLVFSFAAGLPVWALTGSRRKAQNFSFAMFADTASALIGLKLEVKNEQNLFLQRPAVFIFNHQSKADVVIMASLLRHDVAGIGKQEIKKMPIIGKVMEYSGVVFIDRGNAASAIESMKPLINVIRNEGKSVVMSPEGTRTVSPRLAPFKKGAFHLAMQAGVPIVPIVIHNALDVAPKGDFIFHPATVEVEVLPAVDTRNWTAANINEHVTEVRGMFLKALGQTVPGQPATTAKTETTVTSPSKSPTTARPKAKTKAKSTTTPKPKAKAAAKAKAKPKARPKPKSKATPKAKLASITPLHDKQPGES